MAFIKAQGRDFWIHRSHWRAGNSYHHQTVKTLAPAWPAMAVAPGSGIETAYMPDRRFVWAVQWYPEFSFRVDENSKKLFHAFVLAAEEDMGR